MSAFAVREFIGAFALSVAGLAAAVVILWGWEARALHRALTLPAVTA